MDMVDKRLKKHDMKEYIKYSDEDKLYLYSLLEKRSLELADIVRKMNLRGVSKFNKKELAKTIFIFHKYNINNITAPTIEDIKNSNFSYLEIENKRKEKIIEQKKMVKPKYVPNLEISFS